MSIKFREFENRDIDFVYHCKNDENLSRLIVGEFKPISKSEAIQWVEGCKGHHDDYIFWAICKDDESEDIIGWASLANINKVLQLIALLSEIGITMMVLLGLRLFALCLNMRLKHLN